MLQKNVYLLKINKIIHKNDLLCIFASKHELIYNML